MADYLSALAAGDLDAIVASFEPGGYAREPAGGDYVHRGPEGLGEFYERLFSNGGGIPLEHCSVTDDERTCALEYNSCDGAGPSCRREAGIAVYVQGESGRLAAPASTTTRTRRSAGRRSPRLLAVLLPAPRLFQPWKGERSSESHASRSPGR